MANTKVPIELSSTPGIVDNSTATAITIDGTGAATFSSTLTAQKLVSTNGVLELDDNGSHNGIINSPASLFINIDSDNGATGEDFIIGKDRNGTSGGTELFRVQEDGKVGIGGTASHLLAITGLNTLGADTSQQAYDNARFRITHLNNSALGVHMGYSGANSTYIQGGYNEGTTAPLALNPFGSNVGIGTSAPDGLLNLFQGSAGAVTANTSANGLVIEGSTQTGLSILTPDASTGNIFFGDATSATVGRIRYDHSLNALSFWTDNTQRVTIGSSGNVGIGTSLPSAGIPLTAYYSSTSQMHLGGVGNIVSNNTYFNGTAWVNRNSAVGGAVLQLNTDGSFAFRRAGTGASPTLNYSAVIDASGNLLVGKTAANFTVAGHELKPAGFAGFTRNGGSPVVVNRLTNDGALIEFYRGTATVGIIQAAGGDLNIGTGDTALLFTDSLDAILPATTANPAAATRDNAIDLGRAATRFQDIYATNGAIQTSDRNEKQDIEALSDAETAVAVACKGLLRKFRWIDAVEAKGDDARIHFGIIAQDLQAAFKAEGLDAGRYAMFISSTWWETQTEVDAVEAVEFVEAVEAVYDEDGEIVSDAVEGVEAVEAKDAYTRTDTFATLEEAPEGATERTRLGVRYPELLAFIIAAI